MSKIHQTHFQLFPIQPIFIQQLLQWLNLIQHIVIFEINVLDYF